MDTVVDKPSFGISTNAAKRIAALTATEGSGVMFRIAVNGGGCSGYQYDFSFDDTKTEDDLLIERDGAQVLVDAVSLEFLGGAEIDFVEDLMGAHFEVKNPNAKSSCGCGTSFSV
ncbi:MAG: iron-sulfur cluster insertion protein ErpA [Alphaproteobacteria bacterium]|nr:iron-sulfur cluster insertion protein ErpA [Alphaproteobacteria bacterium]